MSPSIEQENYTRLSPEQTFRALLVFAYAHLPTFIWGNPGIGKSDVIRQLAAYFGAAMNDVRLFQYEPTEIRISYNVMPDGTVKLGPPWFVPKPEVPTVLFWDDVTNAPSATQAALYEALLDWRIGQSQLGVNCVQFLASNYESNKGIVFQPPTPVKTRTAHVNMQGGGQSWLDWANRSGQAQKQQAELPVRSTEPHMMRSDVVAFNMFTQFVHLDEIENTNKEHLPGLFRLQTFSTARGMEFLSRVIDAMEKLEGKVETSDIEHAIYGAVLGKNVGTMVAAFMQVKKDLPNLDQIEKDPMNAPMPQQDSVGTLYALSAALSRRASPKNFSNLIKYMTRKGMAQEFSTFFVRDAIRRDLKLTEVREFQKWAVDNHHVIV